MLNLTEEQIEAAAKAMANALWPLETWEDQHPRTQEALIKQARAAAPFLQGPWEMPTDDEHMAFVRDTNETQIPGGVRFDFSGALKRFVSRRNASLLPKPVDPRVAKVAKILEEQVFSSTEDRAKQILAALDSEAAHG